MTTTTLQKNTKTTRDIVTDTFIAQLEQGKIPWFFTLNRYGSARNYLSKHVYRGINMVLMNSLNHTIPYYMTFRQAKDQGGRIHKGAKSEKVVYYDVVYKDADNATITKEEAKTTENATSYNFIKYYPVFNIADIERLSFDLPDYLPPKEVTLDQLQEVVENMPKSPTIQYEHEIDYYDHANDTIRLKEEPGRDNYDRAYSELFYQLILSTSHEQRLNRERTSHDHGTLELLTADIGASMLCAHVGISCDLDIDPIAYAEKWAETLKKDNRLIFKAAAQAQKALDYILNR